MNPDSSPAASSASRHSDRERELFARTELLLGEDAMRSLASARVILFGTGGVGSWCAEALVRSGVRHLAIVDADTISASNVNRQIMADSTNVGEVKVAVMKERLLRINPEARIEALDTVFTAESAAGFSLGSYDCIIDCIDSLKDKISLILEACRTSALFFSSMGSALKTDPSKVRIAPFWKVRGCPFASIIRKRMRQNGTLPARDFLCVYDEEVLPNLGAAPDPEQDPGLFKKARVNGTVAYITGIFGLTLAGLAVNALTDSQNR